MDAWRCLRCLSLFMLSFLVAALFSNAKARAEASAGAITQLEVSDADRAAAKSASESWHHILPMAGVKGVPLDYPATLPSLELGFAGTVPLVPAPGFYEGDVIKVSSIISGLAGKTIGSAVATNIYVNCANPTTCWGNPSGFLTDLGKSTFVHLLDQYTGQTANNRYRVASGHFSTNVTVGPSGFLADAPDIQSIVHSAAAMAGAGYGHIYHVFLPQGVDECMTDSSGNPIACYAPDSTTLPAVFCAYHSSVTFSDIGHVIYTVEPFQNVSGCQVQPPAPNGELSDSTDSVLGHETFETISDPDGDAFRSLFSAAVFADEIGDLCQGAFTCQFTGNNPCQEIVPISVVNGHKYRVQLQYSNHYHGCASTR